MLYGPNKFSPISTAPAGRAVACDVPFFAREAGASTGPTPSGASNFPPNPWAKSSEFFDLLGTISP
jgi:hypothetical protein